MKTYCNHLPQRCLRQRRTVSMPKTKLNKNTNPTNRPHFVPISEGIFVSAYISTSHQTVPNELAYSEALYDFRLFVEFFVWFGSWLRMSHLKVFQCDDIGQHSIHTIARVFGRWINKIFFVVDWHRRWANKTETSKRIHGRSLPNIQRALCFICRCTRWG